MRQEISSDPRILSKPVKRVSSEPDVDTLVMEGPSRSVGRSDVIVEKAYSLRFCSHGRT